MSTINHDGDSHNGPLPESGWYTLKAWADLIGYGEETLRKKMIADNFRFTKWGARFFLRAEDFWEDLGNQSGA